METERDPRGWIQTFTGRQFWPLDPRPEDVDIEDIAHALSNVCRFTGHCRQFYSVAQHSVIVAQNVPQPLRLVALLHDASEAYVCDVARPVKHSPAFEGYRAIEERLSEVIGRAFGVDLVHLPAEVKEADNRTLSTERRDLMMRTFPWEIDAFPPYETQIDPWRPQQAELLFRDALELAYIDAEAAMRKQRAAEMDAEPF